MELYQELVKKSITSFRTADHLTYVTFPLIRETKLILTILDNINLSLTNAMNAALEYEKYYKRIMSIPDHFDLKYALFEDKLINKYSILRKEAQLIHQIHHILESHKQSPIEFSRRDKFVICNHNYQMKTITIPEVKEFLSQTRTIITKITKGIK